jgi:hypothetical protein
MLAALLRGYARRAHLETRAPHRTLLEGIHEPLYNAID